MCSRQRKDSTRVLHQQINASATKWGFCNNPRCKLLWDPVSPQAEKNNHSPSFLGCAMWKLGSQFPDQRLDLGPQYWKHGVLTTAPARKLPSYCWLASTPCPPCLLPYLTWRRPGGLLWNNTSTLEKTTFLKRKRKKVISMYIQVYIYAYTHICDLYTYKIVPKINITYPQRGAR